MRIVALSLAASVALASPALANEGRIEARGGVVWGGGTSEGAAGIAAGYDWDLGDAAFVGVEVSGDKVLQSGTRVSLGLAGRVGAKMGEAGKIYTTVAYQSKFCSTCDDSVAVGAGYQHNLGGNLYGKVEYRRFFYNGTDGNAAVAGLGMKF